jgi:5'-3' exonuclease
MGVPSLYRWLTQKYPEIKRIVKKDSHRVVDNLYLDFNAIIHPCCNKALDCMENTDRELYSNLTRYLDEIMERIKPRSLLYISIDGVAPRAKLNQQRARRFTSAKESNELGEVYFKDDLGVEPIQHVSLNESTKKQKKNPPSECKEAAKDEEGNYLKEVFDTNSITPGTEFMCRLDIFIQNLIRQKMSTEPLWKNINVIFSGYKVPGEGEQKIMEYIRKNQSTKAVHVIYSPDADLIFLGLTLYDFDVMILREEPKKPAFVTDDRKKTMPDNKEIESIKSIGKYSDVDLILVDIIRLRAAILKDFKSVIKVEFDHRRLMEDWVFLCFLVGNDFLPCTPCFEIRTNALEKITNILETVFLRTRNYITDRGKVNYEILRQFFIECSKRENDFLYEKRNNLIKSRERLNMEFNHNEEYPLTSERGKIRFYMEKMNIKSEAELMKACKEYIKGFEWIYKYYFYDIASWDWYYPYHFAPFMYDLALLRDLSFKFDLNKPLRPMEQLLAVLPPLSKDLLPAPFHSFFEENSHMYPTEFKNDMFMKTMAWQAVPILPFMNLDAVKDCYMKRQALLSYEEADRNVLGYPLFFSAQTEIVKKVEKLTSSDIIETKEFAGKIFPLNFVHQINEVIENQGKNYINKVVVFSFNQSKGKKK